jgi:hypothetical protein
MNIQANKHRTRSTSLVTLALLALLLGITVSAAANETTIIADAVIVGKTVQGCGGGPYVRNRVERLHCGTEPSIVLLLNSARQTVGRIRTFRHHSPRFQFDVQPGTYTIVVHLQEKPTSGWVKEKTVTAVAHEVTHAGNFAPPVP